LARIDCETYFSNSTRSNINCQACNAVGKLAFKKNGFDYQLCNNCHTLYVSSRPEAESFSDYYTNSPSSKYWATTFYKKTAEARREKIWKPKAKMMANILQEKGAQEYHVIDIGGVRYFRGRNAKIY